MKKLILIAYIFLLTLFPKVVKAQDFPYVINNFQSNIVVNKDTSITATEKIDVDFSDERHGIFRYIPTIYKSADQTINSRFKLISVLDENGKKVEHKVEGDSA